MPQPPRPERAPSSDRGLRLRDIVAEVGSMISHAEDLRDHTQAESLRVLLRHFQSELVHLQTLERGTGNGELHARGSQSMERTKAPPAEAGGE